MSHDVSQLKQLGPIDSMGYGMTFGILSDIYIYISIMGMCLGLSLKMGVHPQVMTIFEIGKVL